MKKINNFIDGKLNGISKNTLPIFDPSKGEKIGEVINSNFDEQTQKLKEEGWVRTDSNFIEAIQEGPNKVHLTMIQSRIHSDGSEYNRFQTLWIFIYKNDRWGVKFRSSFLVNATENTNFGTL